MRIFNNIFYNTPQINLTQQDSPDASNEIWFFNNVVKQNGSCINVGTTKSGAAFGRLVIQNNIFISDTKSTIEGAVNILDSADLGANSKIQNNAVYLTSTAAGLGMSQEGLWKPSQPISALVDKGADFAYLTLRSESANAHRRDRLGSSRPQGSGWDIGAYEYGSTTSLIPPAAPSVLTATAGSTNRINLAWADNATTETGFAVERSLSSSLGFAQIATVGANITSFSDTGLSAGTTYYYRVRAFNSGGNSAYAGPVSATTASVSVPTVPTAPTSLAATAIATDRINVAWADSASTESGFAIERSLSASSGFAQISTVGANVTSFSDSGLSANTIYYYRVRAFNSAGNSAYAGPVSATTAPIPVVVGHPIGVMVNALTGAASSTFASDSEAIFQGTQKTDLSGSRAVFRFEVAEAGDYIVAAVVEAPSDASNSLFVNVNTEPLNPQSVWHVPVAAGFATRACSWQGAGTYAQPEFSPKVFALSPGSHDVILVGREANVRIKSIGLVKRPSPPPAMRLAQP